MAAGLLARTLAQSSQKDTIGEGNQPDRTRGTWPRLSGVTTATHPKGEARQRKGTSTQGEDRHGKAGTLKPHAT